MGSMGGASGGAGMLTTFRTNPTLYVGDLEE